jgi:hypothetical protein
MEFPCAQLENLTYEPILIFFTNAFLAFFCHFQIRFLVYLFKYVLRSEFKNGKKILKNSFVKNIRIGSSQRWIF